MDSERSLEELSRYTRTSERQVRRILREIDGSEPWQVRHRRQGRLKLFWVERPGQVQRLIRRSVPVARLVSASEYAALCGVHRTSIRDRLRSGTLQAVRRKSPSGRVSVLIDLDRFPPRRKKSAPESSNSRAGGGNIHATPAIVQS